MRSSKLVFTLLLLAFSGNAQKPVGVTGFIGNTIDYSAAKGSGSGGDTYYFQAWAANSMLPYFPDPAGLPVFGTVNDGTNGPCSGNILGMQISKLDFATPANSVLTPYTNCWSSFGGAPGDINAPSNTWAGHLSGGDAHNDGTWKGFVAAFRNNILLGSVYRQTSAGNANGDSTFILSPDAGQTWIDYGRYNTYAITAASCSGTNVTLTATNTLSAGQKIYVHDVAPAGYNGKHTLTAATASTVSYTVASCPAVGTVFGAFGPLDASGSAPLGPSDPSYPADMMWPATGGSNPMVSQIIINYGQDGSYPAGIESACDPTVFVCGIAPAGAYLYRVPVGQEMNKALYQWYTCPGYSAYWPVAETVCDGNRPSTWTSTLSSATPIYYVQGAPVADQGGWFTVKYMPSHGSYVVGRMTNIYGMSWMWAPHPWGPYYLIGVPPWPVGCTVQCYGFTALMGYGENVISTTPPRVQTRISDNVAPGSAGYPSGGAPTFYTLEMAGGRVPPVGAARRGDFLSAAQSGMGHRFVSGNEAGAISRRGGSPAGGTLSLDWWTDFWDHGGNTAATNRPYFRDVLSGGSKYFNVMNNASNNTFSGGQGTYLYAAGPLLRSGYEARLVSQFTDSVFVGNSSWTFIGVFNIDAPTSFTPPDMQNEYGRVIPVMGYGNGATTTPFIGVGYVTPGNVCAQWGGQFAPITARFCTAGSLIQKSTWYFLAVSAQANPGGGLPIVSMVLCTGGTCTDYGGSSSAGNGISGNGLTLTCTACSSAPAVIAGQIHLGHDASGDNQSLQGTFGEAGVYSGVVPGHVIREIYRTLRTDWARVGRGTL